jgi:peptide/nickel transport system substrate-binding protein
MNENSPRLITRRPLSRRRLVAGVVAGGAGLAEAALVGCSGAKQGARSSGATPSGTTAAGGTPRSGGAFTAYLNFNTPLDPHKSSGNAQKVTGGALSRIFRFVTAPDPKVTEDHNIENDLGMSAESPDAITWTVKLRPGVRFQNIAPVNGHAVEAEDVKATFLRAVDPATGNTYAGALNMIDPNQIQTPAPDTVVFKLNFPYAPFKRTLANPLYSLILPREGATGAYDPNKVVIGSGPFIMLGEQTDVAYTYKKNPDYYEKGRPYVDNLRIAIVPDTAQQIAQFAAGNLDEILPAPNDVAAVKRNNPQAQITTADDGTPFTVRFQLGDPTGPFLDMRLRQAFSMAVDRDALIKSLFSGDGVTALNMPGYMGKWALQPNELDANVRQYYQFNPAEAKKLISAAGRENAEFKFGYIGTGLNATPTYLSAAQALRPMFAAIGVTIDMAPIDYNKDYVDAGKGYRQGYFPKDTFTMNSISPVTEADEILFGYFSSSSTSNPSHVSDKTIDAMLAKERTLVNDDERLRAIKDIQRYIAAQVYTLPTVAAKYAYGFVQPRVRNYCYTSSYATLTETYAKVWLSA